RKMPRMRHPHPQPRSGDGIKPGTSVPGTGPIHPSPTGATEFRTQSPKRDGSFFVLFIVGWNSMKRFRAIVGVTSTTGAANGTAASDKSGPTRTFIAEGDNEAEFL